MKIYMVSLLHRATINYRVTMVGYRKKRVSHPYTERPTFVCSTFAIMQCVT